MTHKYFTTTNFNCIPETIYSFYTDVDNWNKWDEELEYSNLKMPFANNSVGTIKPKGNSELSFELKNVTVNGGFDQVMNLPFGSKFILTRRIIKKGNECEVTHSGYFEGFFGGIIGFFLKAKYTPLLEKSVFKLKELCENKK
jgi:hypothetical protein